MGKRGLGAFFDFFRVFGAFFAAFLPDFALFSSMSCAYLYVNNFPPTHVSGCFITPSPLMGEGRGEGEKGLGKPTMPPHPSPLPPGEREWKQPLSRSRGRGIRGRRANLASDKETAWDGRGESDCGLRIADCGLNGKTKDRVPSRLAASRRRAGAVGGRRGRERRDYAGQVGVASKMPWQAGGIPRGRDRLQDGVDGNACRRKTL